jgi:hypothetical protein
VGLWGSYPGSPRFPRTPRKSGSPRMLVTTSVQKYSTRKQTKLVVEKVNVFEILSVVRINADVVRIKLTHVEIPSLSSF